MATTNYVLIDFENVQPANLGVLKHAGFKVLVFVGAQQTKVPFDLASAMQALGDAASYLKISDSGRNALDFHIACYLGELAAGDPGASFHVISRDSGFDPLIRHLRERKIDVHRERDLAEIPALRIRSASSKDEKVDFIVNNLHGRGQSRPRKVKTLANTIRSLVADLSQKDLDALIVELERRGVIQVRDGRVTYDFSGAP